MGEYAELEPTKQQLATAKAIKKRYRALGIIKSKRIIFVIVLFLAIGFYGQNFVWVDPGNSCFIVITPSFLDLSNGTIREGISILKKATPDIYEMMCEDVNHISPNLPPMGCPGFGGGCFVHETPNRIYVLATRNNYIRMSTLIAHEVCHAKQFSDGRIFDMQSAEREEECQEIEQRVLDEVQVTAS